MKSTIQTYRPMQYGPATSHTGALRSCQRPEGMCACSNTNKSRMKERMQERTKQSMKESNTLPTQARIVALAPCEFAPVAAAARRAARVRCARKQRRYDAKKPQALSGSGSLQTL